MKKAHGFTLIELMLSLAILAIVAALLIPVSQTLQNKSNLSTATQSIVLALRQAQTFALASQSDSSWGVYLLEEGGSLIIFEGTSYARGTEYEEVTFTDTITVSGVSEIVFQKRTGETANTGDITLTSPSNGTATISVNAKGVVLY